MEEHKYFDIVAANDIRTFVAELNSRGVVKDDIIDTFYNVSKGTYYALIYR
jgi:hypothetical protein